MERKIICIGTATLDVFFIFNSLNFLKKFALIKEKNNVPEIFIDIGGGALNSTFNLKNLNANVEGVVKLGNDFIGRIIEKRIEEKKIPVNILKTKGNSTLSVIFLNKNSGEKYIFTYRGEEIFNKKDIPQYKNSAYLISTGTTPITIWNDIISTMKKNNNFIGILPSSYFLKNNTSKEILKKCDFIVLNEEEAKLILRKNKNLLDFFKELNKLFENVLIKIVTFGKRGAFLIFKNKVIFVGTLKKLKIVDTTGAGDCFASTAFGFIIENLDNLNEEVLVNILKLASINTAYNLREIGAQTGLLSRKKLLKLKNISIKYKVYEI